MKKYLIAAVAALGLCFTAGAASAGSVASPATVQGQQSVVNQGAKMTQIRYRGHHGYGHRYRRGGYGYGFAPFFAAPFLFADDGYGYGYGDGYYGYRGGYYRGYRRHYRRHYYGHRYYR